MNTTSDDPPRVLHTSVRHDEGTVHTLTVSNPTKLNILDSSMMQALRKALEVSGGDPQARAVVLRGSGKHAWIGGADINEMANLDARSAARFIRRLQGLCRTIRDLPVPVIAAIRGYCLGAGLEVAACCDLRLGAQDSSYGMPEVRVGLPSVIEAALLPRIIGVGRTRDLVMTGRLIDAQEAWRWGLLNGLVPDAALDALVDSRVEDILMAGPQAVRLQKRLCKIWEEQPLADAIKAGVAAFAKAFESGEPGEYMGRFLAGQKRPDKS